MERAAQKAVMVTAPAKVRLAAEASQRRRDKWDEEVFIAMPMIADRPFPALSPE
jgi:hypothetical protein